MRKKLLSLLLAALMILGLLPAAALAAEGDAAPAAPAAEDIAVQADEETVTLPVEADDSGSDNPNTPPTLAEGVEESVRKYGFEGIAWELDLSTIFTDANGDALTYKVSVNGADSVEAAEKYSYVCGAANATLKFTANDGTADSDKTYTVTLNVEPKTKLLLESGSSEVAVGTPFTLAMSTIFDNGYGVTVYVSINGADKEFVNTGSVKKVTFSRAFANPGVYTLEFYEKHGPTFVGPYTHTLTVTGKAIENHAPVVKNPTEGPGQLGSGVNRTQWKPDLASIFSDPDGDTLTYSYSIDGSVFSEYYPTVGIHADYLTPDGSHTVTIRATDPYGEYAEFTVTIKKLTNHRPTKKADAPGKLSVFVPVGLTYKVDANLYYEDVDAKDQGKLRFLNNRYQSAGSYTASTVGDTKSETAYCNDTSNESAFSGIEITYTAIGIDDENAVITNGETYSRNLAELNFPGDYKVRINGGAEQDAAESYTFTPSKPGKYYLHFYGSQTKTAEQNYVVKLTVLPNGTEPAPMTVTIGEKNYDVKLTALVGSKSWFGGPDDVPFYLTAVPADFKTLTLTLKMENAAKTVMCNEWKNLEGADNVYTVKNHACSTGDLEVNVSDVIDTSKYGVIPIQIEETTGQITVLLIQVGEPKSNTPPTLAEGVEENVRKYGFEDIAWELDLSTIFTDADGDKLTYKVSVNGADPVDAAEKYSYVCGTTSVTLKFTANDGKADSDKTYTVTLYSNRKTILLKDSGESEVVTGTVFSLSMNSIFQDPAGTGKSFYYSINGAEKEFFGSGQPRRVAFTRAFEKPGTYKLEFYAQHGLTFIGPYTHTLTVTGEEVTNHKPYLLETADAQKPTGDFWVGGDEPHWRPDLTKVFADEDGYATLSFTYKDDLDERFSTFYTGPYQPGYTASKYKVGERTVTIRATDPYGAYVDYTAQFTVKQDHWPVRKADVQDAYTFEVPFGATLTLKAGDYFEDTDEKDIDTEMQFFSPRSATYTYKADGSAESVVTMKGCCNGYASVAETDSVTFTFRTVMPESWPTITNFTVSSMWGVANSDTGAEEGDVAVKAVTVTPYDTLRVANGKAAAGLITIRMDEDVIAAARESYELTGGKATATASTGASVGTELDDDIFLQMADNYRIAHAVSVSQKIQNETYGEYTLTTYYDLMLIGSNARPILAVEKAAVTEKVTQDVAWTIDLNGLFSDADGDPLTYKVSVNGAEATAIKGSTYTYTPADGIHTLVFTANDGKVGSTDTYTVTLLTRRPNAPAWPQIFAYNLKTLTVGSGNDETKYPAGSIPVTPVVVNYDEPLTVDNYTYAGEILLYVNEDYTTTGRGYYQVPKDDVTATYTNGATVTLYGRSNLSFSKWTTPPWVDSYTTYITEDGLTNYYYYVKLLQAETPAFAPSIGNGAAPGTTENNVTTFPAGSGTGAPTVTVTAPASGWAAGENTFTVACNKACVVLVKSGETYTKLTAANSGETHSFTATLAEGDEIIVRLKGDVNGDGVVNNTDTIQARAASLNKATLTEINAACAKVVGGTAVTNTDVIQIGAVALNKAAFQW